MNFRLLSKSVTLNVLERNDHYFALLYFAEFGSSRGQSRKSGWLAVNRFSPEKCQSIPTKHDGHAVLFAIAELLLQIMTDWVCAQWAVPQRHMGYHTGLCVQSRRKERKTGRVWSKVLEIIFILYLLLFISTQENNWIITKQNINVEMFKKLFSSLKHKKAYFIFSHYA